MRGVHRRTPEAWAQLGRGFAKAAETVLELGQQLTRERELRALADGMVGRLVRERDAALSHAATAETRAAEDRDRLARAGEVIEALREQQRRYQPPATREVAPAPQPWQVGLSAVPRWQPTRAQRPGQVVAS